MAAIADLYVDAGSTFTTDIQVGGDNGFPLDLTGYILRGQIRRHPWAKEKFDFVVDQIGEGSLRLTLSESTTNLMQRHPRYMYDVEVVSPENLVTRIVEGQLFVNPNITKSL